MRELLGREGSLVLDSSLRRQHKTRALPERLLQKHNPTSLYSEAREIGRRIRSLDFTTNSVNTANNLQDP